MLHPTQELEPPANPARFRVMILALHTGQRYGDLIHLRWSDFDGEKLQLTQSKRGAKVQIHCSSPQDAFNDAKELPVYLGAG